jgi:hypothetical protein
MERKHGAFLKAHFQGREETTALGSVRPMSFVRLARKEVGGHISKSQQVSLC